jgi:RNA polymerase sigma-70 factor (ECF subfamily)
VGPAGGPAGVVTVDPGRLTDAELVAAAQQANGRRADDCLEELFSRYQSKVAYWCLRISGDRERAADLAQEVFLRVHDRLHTFRRESRFSTWLYTVTRSVAINSGIAARRRRTDSLDADEADEPVDPAPGADERVARGQRAAWLRRAMAEALDPLEARVLYLHFVDGLTLPGITDLLGLTNKSGAKAFIVSGKRKLHRRVASGGSI